MNHVTGAPNALAIEDEKPKMEESFKQHLTTVGIPPTLITLMEQENIHSPADLPRYCLEKRFVNDHLIQMCDETRGSRKLMPVLVKIWEEAEEANKESASRLAKGVDDEEIERP